jgi:hypothetical protein
MALINQKWSREAAGIAFIRRQFIPVSDFTPRANVSMREARTIWKYDPQVAFQPTFRMVGYLTDISDMLTAVGFDDAEKQSYVDAAIIEDTYLTTHADVYNDEMIKYREWVQSALYTEMQDQGNKLSNLIASVQPQAVLQVSKRRVNRGGDLTARLRNLPPNKVIDVSALQEDGTKALTVDTPTQRSRKFWSPNVPIITNDLPHYILAVSMLPGGSDAYAEHIEYVRQRITNPAYVPPYTPDPVPLEIAPLLPAGTITEYQPVDPITGEAIVVKTTGAQMLGTQKEKQQQRLETQAQIAQSQEYYKQFLRQ